MGLSNEVQFFFYFPSGTCTTGQNVLLKTCCTKIPVQQCTFNTHNKLQPDESQNQGTWSIDFTAWKYYAFIYWKFNTRHWSQPRSTISEQKLLIIIISGNSQVIFFPPPQLLIYSYELSCKNSWSHTTKILGLWKRTTKSDERRRSLSSCICSKWFPKVNQINKKNQLTLNILYQNLALF